MNSIEGLQKVLAYGPPHHIIAYGSSLVIVHLAVLSCQLEDLLIHQEPMSQKWVCLILTHFSRSLCSLEHNTASSPLEPIHQSKPMTLKNRLL